MAMAEEMPKCYCYCLLHQKDGKIVPWIEMGKPEMELFDHYAFHINRLLIQFTQGISVKHFAEFYFAHTNEYLDVERMKFARIEDYLYHLAIMPVMLIEFRAGEDYDLCILLNQFSSQNPMKTCERSEFLFGKRLISPMEFLRATGGCFLTCNVKSQSSPPISRISRSGTIPDCLIETPSMPYEEAFPELWPKSNYCTSYQGARLFYFPRHPRPLYVFNRIPLVQVRPVHQPLYYFDIVPPHACRFPLPYDAVNSFHNSRFPAHPSNTVELPKPPKTKLAKLFHEKVNSIMTVESNPESEDDSQESTLEAESNPEAKICSNSSKDPNFIEALKPPKDPDVNFNPPNVIPPLMSICVKNVALTSIYQKSGTISPTPNPQTMDLTEKTSKYAPTADFTFNGNNDNFQSIQKAEEETTEKTPSQILNSGSEKQWVQKTLNTKDENETFAVQNAEFDDNVEEELLFEQIPQNPSNIIRKNSSSWIDEVKNEDIIEKFMKSLDIERSPTETSPISPESSSIDDEDCRDIEPPFSWFSAKLNKIDDMGFIYFPYKKKEHKGRIYGLDFFHGTKIIANGMKGIGKNVNCYLTLRRFRQSAQEPIYEIDGVASKEEATNENANSLLKFIYQNARPAMTDSKSVTLCYAEYSKVFIQNRMYLNVINQWIMNVFERICKLKGDSITYQNVLYLSMDVKKKNFYRTYILNEDNGNVSLYLIDIGIIVSVPLRVVTLIQMDRYPQIFPPVMIELDNLAEGVELFGIKEILDVEFVNQEIKKINPKMKIHRVLNRLQAEFFFEKNGLLTSLNQMFVENGKAK